MSLVEKKFDMLSKMAPSAQEMIYQTLIQELKEKECAIKGKGARIEAEGIHFIDGGEVLVVGERCTPNARLNKCDAFGLCELLRKTGPEFLGDIRASIRKV